MSDVVFSLIVFSILSIISAILSSVFDSKLSSTFKYKSWIILFLDMFCGCCVGCVSIFVSHLIGIVSIEFL